MKDKGSCPMGDKVFQTVCVVAGAALLAALKVVEVAEECHSRIKRRTGRKA